MNRTVTPVDWHVHVHQPDAIAATLDSAAEAFARVAPESGEGLAGVLMLAEMPGQQVFATLRRGGTPLGWSIGQTEEPQSLILRRGAVRIGVIGGFQVTTAERLEILALGTTDRPAEGDRAEAALDRLAEADVLAVLPWGVGKWLGARGAVIAALLQARGAPGMALGDNAARPGFLPRPAQFGAAARRGVTVLPGTDTLPGARPAAGQFGSLMPGGIDAARPLAALRHVLAGDAARLRPYGRLASPACFLRDQAMLRLRRLGRR